MKETLQLEDIFDKSTSNDIEVKSPSEQLEIPDVKVEVEIKFDPIVSKSDKEDFIDDIQYVRTKLLHSIGKADKLLDNLVTMIAMDEALIEMSQPPKGYYRYYDVSTSLLKSITEASKELINLHSQNLKIKKEMEWIKEPENQETEIEESKKEVNKKKNINDLIKEVKSEKGESNEN